MYTKFGMDLALNYLVEFKTKFGLPLTIQRDFDLDTIVYKFSDGLEFNWLDEDEIIDIYDLSDFSECLYKGMCRMISLLRELKHITKDTYMDVWEWLNEESKPIDFLLTLINNFDC